MADLEQKAQAFLALHRAGTPVVLPTVWDPWSAQLAVDAGFSALTIGSHPVADALGRPDGEGLTLTEMLAQVALVCRYVDVPVSADLESGYGAEPARLVAGLLEAGAIGLNVEDSVHSEDDRIRSAAEHAEYIAGLRTAADSSGVHVVINARTDILLKEIGPDADRMDRAVAQLSAAGDAGADVLYPVGLHDDATYTTLVESLPLPINALARPDADDLGRLSALGVGRVSFGPFLQRAMAVAGTDLLAAWTRSHS